MEKELNNINFERIDEDIDTLLSNLTEANELYKSIENTLETLNNVDDSIKAHTIKTSEQINELRNENKEIANNIENHLSGSLNNLDDLIKVNSTKTTRQINELIEETKKLSIELETKFTSLGVLLDSKFNEQYIANAETIKEINNLELMQNKLLDTTSTDSKNTQYLIDCTKKDLVSNINELRNENKVITKNIENHFAESSSNSNERHNKLEKKLNLIIIVVIVITILNIIMLVS